MSDIVDFNKVQKITLKAYNEIKKKETEGKSKEQIINKIIEMMKKELENDVD